MSHRSPLPFRDSLVVTKSPTIRGWNARFSGSLSPSWVYLRTCLAALVGSGREYSPCLRLLVDRLSKRLVRLSQKTSKLFSYLLIKEVGHHLQRLGCFGEAEVIPERVRERFEDNQLRVITRM